jgi:nucleotide-binding universal stress UspA family protein
VAVDGSVPSLRGLQEAIRLAKTLDAALKLLHVVDLSFTNIADTAVAFDQIAQSMNEMGANMLADCRALARKADVPCETKLVQTVSGDVASQVVREATLWGADLLVLGTHGRRGFKRLALGSDAELVLRHSPVPVLLVREQPEQK